MSKLNDFVVDVWHCNDPRLPKTEDIMREPPESSFVMDIVDHGQLQPIMMCHNDADGWFLAFGRRRLLAIRQAFENSLVDGNVYVRIGEGLSKNDGNTFALVENAQRSGNPISDYLAIREMLFSKEFKSYEEIAQALHVSKAYVKNADEKYAHVPQWALEGVVAGNVAQGVAIAIGKLSVPKQKEAKALLKKEGKITGGMIKDMRRAILQDTTSQVTALAGFDTKSDGLRQFFNRDELLPIQELLAGSKTTLAKKALKELLDQKE
jgi:ParB-like chromosome segregation protein Spo0J